MKGPRIRGFVAPALALVPAVASAQQSSGFSHGWAYALAAVAIVGVLFLAVFRRRPPPQGRDDTVAPPPR